MELQGGSGAALQNSGGAGIQNAAGTARIQNAAPSTVTQNPVSGLELQNNNAIKSTNSFIGNATAQIGQTNNELASIEKQIQAEIQAQKPAVAPTLNLDAIRSAATAAAGKSVNPLYTQQLNEYLQNEAAAKAEQEQQNQLNIQGYQTSAANTLAQNQLTEQNAAEQNALTQGNINAESANYQLNSGTAENAKIAALQQSNGSGGIAASGLGAQNLWMAENAKNVADAQQQGTFQYNRDVANQAANMTFAQMNLSSGYAQKQESAQEAQSKFSLNSYLRQASYDQQQYTNSLNAWKQQALTSAEQNNEAAAVQKQLNAYRGNAGVYAAGEQAYSPYLSTSAAPALVNQLSYAP